MPSGAMDQDRRRFLGACTTGFTAAGAVALWLLIGPDGDLFRREPLGGFYETQARAWLHGHWNVAPTGVLYEVFVIHGRNYLYFGPWPAFLRLPLVAFTHALDGRVTGVSMLAAYVVFAVFAARFAWLSRRLLRGNVPVGRLETVATAVLAFALAAGSSIFFLASRTLVYHEAILWGVAWTVAGLYYVARFAVDGQPRSLVLAGTTTTLAVLSRVSVGLAAVAALVFVAGAKAGARIVRRRTDERRSRFGRTLGWPEVADRTAEVRLRWVVMAVVVPIGLYAYVNYTKFGSAFGLPLDKQFLVRVDASRRAAISANSLTGLRFVPSTIVQYLRPDALSFDRLFPWVTFPGPARVFGNAHFATLDFSSSVTTSMTALLVLWIVGAVALFRPISSSEPSATTLRLPVLAGLVGCLSVLAFGFIADRYMADFIPALVVGSCVGFHFTARWASSRVTRRAAVRVAVTGLSVVVAWTCFVQLGLALQYQRAYGLGVADETRTSWLGFQLDVHDQLPGGRPSDVITVPGIPPVVGPNGQLLIVGRCAGLIWSDGRHWHAVERTPATGQVHLRLMFPSSPARTVEPLVTTGDAQLAGLVLARFATPDRVVVQYAVAAHGTTLQRYTSPAFRILRGHAYDVDIRLDPLVPVAQVTIDGKTILDVSLGVNVVGGRAIIGRDPFGGPDTGVFSGRVVVAPTPTPLCDRLRR